MEVLSEMASKGVLSQVLFQPRRTAPLGGPHLVTNEDDGVNAWPFCPPWEDFDGLFHSRAPFLPARGPNLWPLLSLLPTGG